MGFSSVCIYALNTDICEGCQSFVDGIFFSSLFLFLGMLGLRTYMRSAFMEYQIELKDDLPKYSPGVSRRRRNVAAQEGYVVGPFDFETNKQTNMSYNSVCGICMDTTALMFATQRCDHQFCVECLKQHIQSKVEMKELDVPCPDTNCRRKLDPDTLRQAGREVDVAKLEAQRKDKIIHQDPNFRACTAPGCWGGQVCSLALLTVQTFVLTDHYSISSDPRP